MRIFATRMSLAKRAIVVTIATLALFWFGRDIFAWTLVGRCDTYLLSGDAKSGLRYAERALVFDPSYPDAAQRITLISIRSRKVSLMRRAAQVDSDAVLRAPHDENLKVAYATLLFGLHRYKDSAAEWLALSRAHPDRPLYRGWVAESARFAGECSLAIEYYSNMQRANRSNKRTARMLRQMHSMEQQGRCT